MTIDTNNKPLLAAVNNDVLQEQYRRAPHNLEAEQSLLGAMLVNNESAGKVSDFLRPDHFYEPVHQRIFDAIMKLTEKGQIANPVTLKHYFDQDDALSDVGGAQYLARLAGAATSVINSEHYGRVVFDLALRRELIAIGENMVNDAYDAELQNSSLEQLESAEQRLFGLAETGQHDKGFVDFNNALSQAIETAEAAFRRDGHLTGIATHLIDLDNKLGGLHPSDLVILAGRPAMGKTALATNIAFSAANSFRTEVGKAGEESIVDGAAVAFFSLEMSAQQLATRILAEQAEISSDKIRRGDISGDNFSSLVNASQRIQDMPLFIDDTPALTIAALRTRARRLKRTQNIGLIIVDYLQLLRPSNRSSENRVQEISEITQGLKALAKDLDVPVLALSQLSRQVEQREDKRPQLSDLRESGSIEQDADVVMFVFREEYYHERHEPEMDTEKHFEWQEKMNRIHGIAELIIGKQRHGPTGSVRLLFEREFTKFRNLDMPGNLSDVVD